MDREKGVPKWSPTEYANVHKHIEVLCGETLLCYSTDLRRCESPIEELFLTGLYHELGFFSSKAQQAMKNSNYIFNQQETIQCGDNTYRVDFHIIKFEAYNGHKIGAQIVVECDGYEFHSDKEQINSDNQRDIDILAYYGMPTIRFLGSELNKNPFECARTAINALSSLLKKKISLVKKYDNNE